MGETSVAEVYDRIVAERLSDLLVLAVRRDIKGSGLTVEWVAGSVIVSQNEHAFLQIKASLGVHLATGVRVDGNYLADGDHWQQLLDAGRPPIRGAFPEGLDESVVDAAVAASRRIYGQRSVSYGLSVLLRDHERNLELRIDPVKRLYGLLQFPFGVSGPTFALEGGLILILDAHPLALMEYAFEGHERDLALGWATALLGVAELTCVERTPTTPTASGRRRGRSFDARPAEQRTLNGRHFRSRSQLLHGAGLTPTADTLAIAGHYVAGHRRRLREDQQCSEYARDNAHAVGITLGDQETWVQPHTRGIPDGTLLEFIWEPPLSTDTAR